VLAAEQKGSPALRAADIMQPQVVVHPEDDLRRATERLVANGLRELPVVDGTGAVVGFLDERDVAKVYLRANA
jgi:CIC family chloride channel protein